jgi:hypothetical protein
VLPHSVYVASTPSTIRLVCWFAVLILLVYALSRAGVPMKYADCAHTGPMLWRTTGGTTGSFDSRVDELMVAQHSQSYVDNLNRELVAHQPTCESACAVYSSQRSPYIYVT